MTKRRVNFPHLKKQDILVYGITHPNNDPYTTRMAADQIRNLYSSHNYPFGYGKLTFHGGEPVGDNFKFYSTVHMTPEQYARKCAYSSVEDLRAACGNWLKYSHPEMVDWFLMKCLEARNLKILKGKQDAKNSNSL